LPQDRVKNAAGLFNLMRNLGGAVGLAGINTVLNDRTDLHLARLHESLTWSRPPAVERLDQLTQRFQGNSDAPTMALKQLMQMTHQQGLVMAFADVFDPEVVGEPGDPPLLADAADLGDIGLHDVEGAARQPGNETLASGQHLPAGDRDRALTAQLAEILEGVGLQRLLEPADIIILQHLRRAQRPFQAMGPIGIARPGIDEEPGIRPRRFARRAHDGLIQLAVAGAPEGAPADLEGAKSLRPIL